MVATSRAMAPPPGNPRFALFDALRALAVLAVVVFHVASLTGALARGVLGACAQVLGAEGPILFFVISGFLLYRPFVAARASGTPLPPIGRYAQRRVLRIVPAYWVALTVLAVFPGVVGVFSDDWWRYYLFLQVYSQDTVGNGIPVAWTLCVEVAFYMSLPLWALAARRLRPTADMAALALVAAGGAAIQLAAARQHVSQLVATSLPGQSTWLALGMALALASVAAERHTRDFAAVRFVIRHPGLCWLGAAAALCGLLALAAPSGLFGIIARLHAVQPIPETLARIALTATMTALLVLPAVFGELAGGLPRRVLAAGPLVWLGVLSYGVYIWHLTVAELLALPSDPGHFAAHGLGLVPKIRHATTPALFVMTFAVAVALAALSYRVVELPFLRRKEGVRRRV